MTGRQTRIDRAVYPQARDSIRKIAEASGGCLRPLQLRRTDTQTGETVSVMVPCGTTLASIARYWRAEGGGALYVDTLKNHRARTVPLVAELVPIIDRWTTGKEPEAWLFAAPGGGPLRESNWKRSVGWRAARVAAGVPDVRVHDLRHTAASQWLAAARTRRWSSGCWGTPPPP